MWSPFPGEAGRPGHHRGLPASLSRGKGERHTSCCHGGGKQLGKVTTRPAPPPLCLQEPQGGIGAFERLPGAMSCSNLLLVLGCLVGLEPGLHIPKPRAWKAEAEMLHSLRKQSRTHKSPHARSIHHPRWIKAVKLMIIISTLCTGKQTAGEEKRPTAGPCGLHGSSAPTHFPGRGMSKRAGAGICWWGQLSQQGTPSLQRSQTFIYFASLVV